MLLKIPQILGLYQKNIGNFPNLAYPFLGQKHAFLGVIGPKSSVLKFSLGKK